MDKFKLEGQQAFVTGAGSGIGQGVAVALAAAGADVACFDLPDSPGLDQTVEQVAASGRKGLAVRGNVVNEGEMEKAVTTSVNELGGLTLAVNSAGIANAHPAEEMDAERWQRMIDVNLTGLFRSCQAEAKAMLPRGEGAIVNVASMSGSIVNRGLLQAHYNTSKAGVIHLSKSLAMEWCDRGVRVNSVSPGYTATPMNLRPEVAEQAKRFEAETPVGRMASVAEIAWPIVFLCTPAASFITGHDLVVDGGFTCW